MLIIFSGLLLAGCGGEASITPGVTPGLTATGQAQLTSTRASTVAATASTTTAVAQLPTTAASPTALPAAGATVQATIAPATTTAGAVSPTALPPTQTPQASPAAVLPTATVPPANLPPRYIQALRNRTFSSEDIQIDRLYEKTAAYTANLIYYKSDGLRISGLMMIPNGSKDQKFPVALINHGYFDPPEYNSGWDTLRELRFFAQNGYITIASDYRNYARSDKGDNDREPGYTIDILNLIAAAKRLPQADPSKITLMGHSMGGEIVLNSLVISKEVKVAALFGSMSADAADNFYARLKWRGGETAEKRIYGDAAQNPETYRQMSPLTFFPDITAPVIIHVGLNDTITPPEWSEKIYKGLQTLRKPSEYYTYPGQGHSLNGDAFNSAMNRTLGFFNKALGR
jgi:dipeptidyl aminopeptidase/acylaminoacyl peptidase